MDTGEPDPKKIKSSKKDGDVQVLQYLQKQNRPYSTNDIFMNLHKEFGKTAVQKSLDNLVYEGKVKEKTYGKQKVYVIDQKSFPPLDQQALNSMNTKIAELTDQVSQKTKLMQSDDVRLRNLRSSITTEEAQKQIELLQSENSSLEVRLNQISGNQVTVTSGERKKIEEKLQASVKEWKKRKRMTMDMLDAILEGWQKSKKELYEEIGIETDDDVGVTMPTV